MATKDVGNLRTRLSWEDSGATSSLTRFKDDLKGLRSEMRTVTSMGNDYKNSLKGLKQQSDVLSRQFKTQEERVKELRKRYEESVKIKGEDNKQTRNLANQYNNAVAQMNDTEQQLKRVTQAIEEQRNPWKRLSREAEAAGQKMQSVGQGLSNFGRDYSMKVTAPIVAGGTAVFKAAMDFESSFAGVAKTFSGSTEQLSALRTSIRDMAKEIPASTTEISAVAEAAGQLGIQTESIEEFTRTMIDLGEATNMTSDQAATEFARFANIVSMSQEDFDNMGSSVVALGNSMATTEAEISSMAMRLAAQGSQVGMTEAQILALSATMSSLGIEAEAGGTAMTTVLKKIDSAVGESGKELDSFAKAAGVSSSDFAKAWNKDPIKALDLFIKGLAESSSEGANLTSILSDLGIKGIRESDTILRLAGASDLLTDAVNTSSKAWEENTALSDEAAQRYATTESQLKIMWNRIKDVAITLGDSLAPAVMDAIDAAEPFIKQIESGAKAFSELDEEQQRTILKMIGMVAAIGPASMALGGLTSGIGGVLKVGSSLSGLLGKAGGAGLLARLGGLGMTGPVGWAVAGVAALGAGMIATKNYFEETNEVTFETVRAMNEEIQATDELIEKFELLRNQNMLTSAEMLEYMDILDDLSSTSSPEKIAELRDRQAELLEKSGYTNEQMEEFLGLNDKIIQQAPNATSAISDQGNAYADNLQALKELNEAKREEMMMIAERELMEGLQKEAELLLRQSELERELVDLRKQRSDAQDKYISSLSKETEIEGQITEIKAEMFDLEQQGYKISDDKMKLLAEEIGDLQIKKQALSEETEEYRKQLDEQEKIVAEKEEGLDNTNEELKRLGDLKYEYEALWLAHLDINAEKGKGLQAIGEEIGKQRDLLKHMEDNYSENQKNTQEYKDAKKEIENQIARLEEAKDELEQINKLASETPYEKDVLINTFPALKDLEKELMKPMSRQLLIETKYRGIGAIPMPSYAAGVNYHPGGPALVGEEGYELAKIGDRMSLLDFGVTNLPRGTQVFTHDESKRILQAMNRIPAYANGISTTGEVGRVLNGLNGSTSQSKIDELIDALKMYSQRPIQTSLQVDSREIARSTHRSMSEYINRELAIKAAFY